MVYSLCTTIMYELEESIWNTFVWYKAKSLCEYVCSNNLLSLNRPVSVTRQSRRIKVVYFLEEHAARFTATCTRKYSRHHVFPATHFISSFFPKFTNPSGYCLSEQMDWPRGIGADSWLRRFPGLSSLDFLFWGQLKELCSRRPSHQRKILSPELANAAADVCDMPGNFQRVWDSMHCRCETCLVATGRSFERLFERSERKRAKLLCVYSYGFFVTLLLINYSADDHETQYRDRHHFWRCRREIKF